MSSSKFSKFSSTSALTLALILLLALTWVLSFRPVRLKIADYYYNQGKFYQAVNWYEKVMRKEKLIVDQGKTNRSKYDEDLSKLKSKFVREMEIKILNVNQLLGFEQAKDLKTILTDQKLFLADINELIGAESKEKLRIAKEELANFNIILDNYKKHDEKKTESGELGYLVSMGYFFKGIIDEAEGNFISADSNYEKIETSYPLISNERHKKLFSLVADKYLYQTPLNWKKATDLYESQIRSSSVNNLDFLLKLGFIHAKFNNYTVSYDFFKKAYELLKNTEVLKRTIDYFKSKGRFVYPDDIGLIPQGLMNQYPFLKEISFFETKNLLNIIGIDVLAKSDGFIGKTGIKSPAEIIIRSAGYQTGNYGNILINRKNFSQNRRGYNIVILNPEIGEVEKSEDFDTCGSKEDVKKMIDFINSIEKGKIVCAAVADDASAQLSVEEGKIFEKIGAKGNLHGKNRWGHGIIGVKGSKYGDAIEAMSEKPLEIYVINQKS